MWVRIISSPKSMLSVYAHQANLEAIQYKANGANDLKINTNIMKHHQAKLRLHSTPACV